MRNPKFLELLEKMKEIHEKKSHDYASDSNVFSNFEYAELVAAPFSGVHKTFATMVGIKLARLAELLSGKEPKNESIFDSFLDLCTYAAIWASYYMTKLANETWNQLTGIDSIPSDDIR